ncbi:G-rich sequence factor 1 [Sardina pilchardus]|uniref:G-rich sequence factor 1 n=1 Tax=Sardina pilchardus TaxID=27697 RepID=UPI002E153D14
MAGYCRTALISTLRRSFGEIRQPCTKIFHLNKPSPTQVMWLSCNRHDRPRYHHWSTSQSHTFLLNVKSTWTSCRSIQSPEAGAPFKENEYPPLPEYTENSNPETKDVYVVHIKGLVRSCKTEDILEFFSDCRIRQGAKGVHFMHHKDGRPNGQAVLEMETEEDVSKALERHKQYLGSRYIEVFEVAEEDEQGVMQSILQGISPPVNEGVVRLRGMSFSCTEKDIIQFFSGLDIVENGVTLLLDRKGRCKGDAYVQFASQEMAVKALERDREVMGRRYIEIFPSSKKEIRQKTQEPADFPKNRTPYPNRGTHTPAASETAGIHRLREGRSAPVSAVPIHYVHMRGLPFGATAEDIVKFFAPMRVARIMMDYRSDGRASGEAEVHFRNHEDAVDAMSKDKEYIGNRYIELFLHSNSEQS